MSGGEFAFIRSIRDVTPPHPAVIVGPGDDCAVLAGPGRLLVTTDVLTEGVDFILHDCGLRAVGRKAMAVNLSDIAAMGGRPLAAVVGVVFPAGEGGARHELHLGLREVADAFRTPLVGGDTNSWDHGLVVSVTVLGEPIREPVLRSGAKPGDWIFVTGPCGGSILGRHLNPMPRLREVEALVTNFNLRSMIDVSDGLAADLNHILEESACGAVLHADAIPIHPDAIELATRSGRTPLDHALSDGEDFELIFTIDPQMGAKLLAAPPVPVWKIGECVTEAGLWMTVNGQQRPLAATGWEHRM
ncbi:MAG: thiamine-phosphate kinase [Fimbriiglobus sp.]|nr:thiamine-phosphate kinase [Fimbriiglobus sp.]